MNIIPCGHRLIVKQLSLEQFDDTTQKAKQIGLIIAGDDQERRQESADIGKVMAIGPTAFRDFGGEPWCSVGDIVAWAKYAGKKVKDLETGEFFQALNDEDIVCVLKKGEVNE